MESGKSPAKKKRMTLKDHIEQAEPFEVVAPTLKPTFTWIEEATFMESDIRMYQGTFKADDGSHVEIPMIPREIVDYTGREDIASVLEHLDLHRFFDFPQPQP